MLTLFSMFILVAFLGAMLLYTDEKGKTSSFFDLENTNCMRGFWCIIIVLVHIPDVFQNKVQDALGSFAFIGVTFFFMTSAYGLMLGVLKDSQAIKKSFWLRRLPKLLVPMFLINIVRVFVNILALKELNLLGLITLTGFVSQLLLFYLLFWIVFRFLPNAFSIKVKSAILCLAVVIFSIIIYLFGDTHPFGWRWHVESLGFAYGILLALFKERFVKFSQSKWLLKSGTLCLLSLIVGVAYLKFKTVVFIGDYLVKILLGLCILILILVLNTKISIGNPIGRFMGKISYEIYLVHDVVFVIITALLPALNSGLFVLFSLIVCVLISFIVNRFSGLILSVKR